MTLENPQLTDPRVRQFIADAMRGELRGPVDPIKSWCKLKEGGEYPLGLTWESDGCVLFTSSYGRESPTRFDPYTYEFVPASKVTCSTTPVARGIYEDIRSGKLTHVKNGHDLPYPIEPLNDHLVDSFFGRRKGYCDAVGRNGTAQVWRGKEKWEFFTSEQVAPLYADSRIAEKEVLALLENAAYAGYEDKEYPLDKLREGLVENATKNNAIVTRPKVAPDGVFTFIAGPNTVTVYPKEPIRMPRVDEAVEWLRGEYHSGDFDEHPRPGFGRVGMGLETPSTKKATLPILQDLFAFSPEEYPERLIVTSVLRGKDKITVNFWWYRTETHEYPDRIKQEYPILSRELKEPPFKLPSTNGELVKFIATPDEWDKPKTKSKPPAKTKKVVEIKPKERSRKLSKTINFTFEKDTKNKRRFAEVIPDGCEDVIGTLYVRKSVVGNAKKVTVTIESE